MARILMVEATLWVQYAKNTTPRPGIHPEKPGALTVVLVMFVLYYAWKQPPQNEDYGLFETRTLWHSVLFSTWRMALFLSEKDGEWNDPLMKETVSHLINHDRNRV